MTPRSLVWFGSLFVASFLATLLINGPGGLRMGRSVQSALAEWRAPPRAMAGLRQATGLDADTALAVDAGPAGDSDAEADFDAAARTAVAGGSSEDRVRAVQVLSSAPAEQGIDALVVVSAQGADAGERATAITSLRQRLGNTGSDERIRNAFRQAATDTDPLVAVLAQSALEDSGP